MALLNKQSFSDSSDGYCGYQVSEFSKWEGSEWLLSKSDSDGRPLKIIWGIKLDDGSFLTDIKNEELLEACKRFIWSLHVYPPRGEGHTSINRKYRSLCQHWSRLRLLVTWMTRKENGYNQFSDLSSIAIDDYVVFVYQKLFNHKQKDPLRKTLGAYLNTISTLYQQRRKLNDAIVVKPFDGVSANKYAKKLTRNEGNKIPYMPDEIAKPVIGNAVTFLEKRAVKWIEFSEFLLPYYYEMEGGKITGKNPNYFKISGDSWCWTLGPKSRHVRDKILNRLQELNIPHKLGKAVDIRALRELHTRIVEEVVRAASVCILGTVGLRASELIHLETSCTDSFESIDGKLNIHIINGVTFKLETGPREATWVAGATPISKKESHPEAVKAIELLTRLLSPWRKAIGSKTLLFTPPNLWLSVTDQQGERKYTRMTTGLLNIRLQHFCDKVKKPYDWKISSHQYRKTFARFVAKRDKNALGALSSHYLHQTFIMTDESYIGRNFELSDLIGEYAEFEVMSKLNALLLNNSKIGGEKGKDIMAFRVKYRGMKLKERIDFLIWLIRDSGLLIHEDGMGLCVHEADEVSCRQDGEVAIYNAMCPSNCNGCGNFVPTEENKPYWLKRLQKNQDLLIMMSDASEIRKSVPRRIVKECKEVLGSIT